MIIDHSYFIGDILLPGLGTTPVQNSVNLFIEKHEPKYLCDALGYAFYKLYAAGMEVETPTERWTDLTGGAEYNNCHDVLKNWEGLQNDEKQSPIAEYIYYWYCRNNVTFTATVGEQEGKTDNAKTASPDPKMVRAWNEMVHRTWSLQDFLLNKKDEAGELVYPEFKINEAKCFKRMNVYGL